MSASTVSLTANARRRPSSSVAGDVKQAAVDLLNDTIVSPITDKSVADDKDLSHSIRGEAVLERSSKDTRKPQIPSNSNPPLRTRNRKVSSQQKPLKPRWKTVLSVLVKNMLLLLVLLGLVQMVRKFVVDSRNGGVSESVGLLGLSDMEGRIAQVESSLKTTSKMLQVQVEIVDKKVESLVGDARKDLSRRIEEKSVEIDSRLRELGRRSEAMKEVLSELKSKELLTKEDLVRLYDELKKGMGGGGIEMGLDEVRALAREVVEKEIEKHAADGLGLVDYALASGGAVVVKHSEALVVGKGGGWIPLPRPEGVHSNAEKMLKPSFGEPGHCFPLKGSSGFVQIRLRTSIVPEAITLEHVAERVAYDRTSAPKHCRVSGWQKGWQGQEGFETELAADGEKMIVLTEFTYDLDKSNAQTFNVFDSASSAVIDTIRFDFSSNHGNPSHTCIYRLRVHGHEPRSIQMVGADY